MTHWNLHKLIFLPLVVAKQYLLISQPHIGTVSSVSIDDQGIATKPVRLITGLQNPLGLATDANNGFLYVSDTISRKIFRYKLLALNHDALVTDGMQYIALANVEARWLSVDEAGNVLYTEEGAQTVKRLPSFKPSLEAIQLAPTLFSADSSTTVSKPGGISANMRYIFWTNKADGEKNGVLIRVDNSPEVKLAVPTVLARNVNTAYGVCTNQNHVFFTGKATNIYMIDQHGGPVSMATSNMTEPRGCTWDGDATMYVADKKANAVMSFAAGHTLATVNPEKIVDIEGPYDVAILSFGGASTWNLLFVLLLLL